MGGIDGIKLKIHIHIYTIIPTEIPYISWHLMRVKCVKYLCTSVGARPLKVILSRILGSLESSYPLFGSQGRFLVGAE